jgi:transposase-like protein
MTNKCYKCNKYFISPSKLKDHLNRKISCDKSKEELKCNLCNVIFLRKQHQEIHNNTKKHLDKIDNLNKGKNLNKINEINKLNTNNLNKHFEKFIIKTNQLEIDEYIYIATTNSQAMQHIFKLGRTNNLKSRLSSYNTGRIEPFFYCIYYKCTNAKSIEKRIFDLLENFKVKNEMYQIKYEILNDIVKEICENDLQTVNKINNYISSDYKTDLENEGISFN